MSELEFDASELPPPPSPPKTACIVCTDCDIYDHAPPPLEGGARPAEPWKLRCAPHTTICCKCYKPKVTDDRKDYCRSCAASQFLCIVCVAMHCTYEVGDPIHQPIAVGQKRCFRHQGWCAACMKFSVESDADDICAKCKRDGYRAAYSAADVDFGQLRREKTLCFHDSATPCRSPGQWDHICSCDCYWCNNRYGWVQPYGPRVLPRPPSAEEDAREAMFQKIMAMSRDERIEQLTQLWAAATAKPG